MSGEIKWSSPIYPAAKTKQTKTMARCCGKRAFATAQFMMLVVPSKKMHLIHKLSCNILFHAAGQDEEALASLTVGRHASQRCDENIIFCQFVDTFLQ